MRKFLFILSCLWLCQMASAQNTPSSTINQTPCSEKAQGVSSADGALQRNSQPVPVVMTTAETYQLMDCFDSRLATRYRRFCKMRRVGTVLTIAGACATVGGVAMMVAGANKGDDSEGDLDDDTWDGLGLCLGGVAVSAVGVSALGAGIPLMVVGKHQKQKQVDEFSSRYLGGAMEFESSDQSAPYVLSVNGAKKGFGVVLKF